MLVCEPDYAKVMSPKNSGLWKSGSFVSMGAQLRKCGSEVKSAHL